jgi:beta-glucosidase
MTELDEGLRFGDGFLFGTATSAYQIEGAVHEDGRGPSIWDTFSHTPGKTRDGDTGDVACDAYHRYREDIALMADLGLSVCRFSIAWPRIQPTGRGAPNPAGIAHYDRLVDALLGAGIAPCPTLYHWDLPQTLEDGGGWLVRDTADRFAEYAGHVGAALGDRVRMWITLNEPNVVTWKGYGLGRHAPGRTLLTRAFPVAHYQLLGHGLAVGALRSVAPGVSVGIANNVQPVHPASDNAADVAAARLYDAMRNRVFVDSVLLGTYPDELPRFHGHPDPALIADGDLATISAPLDFLGVNYYNPEMVRAGDSNPLGVELALWPDAPRTAFDWPVVPDGMFEVLTDLRDGYGEALPPIYVTENGAAFEDTPEGSTVHDPQRVEYLDAHLRAVRRAIDAGVDVRGYFCWSLLDNFEWAEGYSKRFGLVYVDYPTQRRIPKDSYAWYRRVIAAQR